MTTDRTASIRKILKSKHGWTSHDVSVRANGTGSILVIIKNPDVPMNAVKDVACAFETIHRDHVSGDILSGGNTFVQVQYSPEARAAHATRYGAAVEAAAAKMSKSEPNALYVIAGTPFLLGYGMHVQNFSLWNDEGHLQQCWDVKTVAQEIGARLAGEVRS